MFPVRAWARDDKRKKSMPKYPTSFSAKSIYIDLREMRKYLKEAMFLMTKGDRIVYGTPMLQAHAQCLRVFVIAQEFKEEQYENLKRFVGYFAEFRMEMDLITEENVIHFAKPKDAEKLPALQLQIFTYIDRIDTALEKWKSSVRKGKTLVE